MVMRGIERKTSFRLLLINPWIYDFSAFDLWSKPIGLLYVAAYLIKIGYKITLLDCLDKHHPGLNQWLGQKRLKIKSYGTGPYLRHITDKPDILNFIPRHYARYGIPEELFISELKSMEIPDAILVTSFMTYWYQGPLRVIELVRQIFPKIPVILGGIYATLLPDHAKTVLKPDYIIEGPGEIKVAETLGQILKNAPKDENSPQSLDDFPSPDFGQYQQLDYLPVMTSRGCPYHCTFCATDKISGKFAQREPKNVVAEILKYSKKFRVKDVAFYDDALLVNRNGRLLPILEKIIESKVNLRFHTPNGLHAKEIDDSVAQMFYQSGFETIRLSFETVNPDRLTDMKNKVTPSDLRSAVINLEHAGYHRKSIEAYVLMGLPDQSFEEIYESILFVHLLGIKIKLASYSPIPGTIEYHRAVESGLFPADADPLLTNKTIYPLFRNIEAYENFSRIRQLAIILNQGIDRNINIFKIDEFQKAFRKVAKFLKS
jgi:radical SAM superfamily enzyme YgiQ (UPF0313 family)